MTTQKSDLNRSAINNKHKLVCINMLNVNFIWLLCVLLSATVLSSGYRETDRGYRSYSKEYTVENYPEDKSAYRYLCIVAGLCVAPALTQFAKFKKVYNWSQLEFDYPSNADRQHDIDTGVFIPGTPAPIDLDVFYSETKPSKVFVTIPRFQPGIPVTLGTVKTSKSNRSPPVIKPYPSWSWQQNPEVCKVNRIVSVFRVEIDQCGRLWVLDAGRNGDKQTCPPQILAFDLYTDRLLYRYEIPEDQLEPRSILVTPVVDVRDTQCKNTFVYAADCQTYSLIVYDVNRHTSWKVSDKTMYPYPSHGTFKIQGEQFDLMDGILGMALSPYVAGQDRTLFYHAMSSPTENWVYTSYLRNQSLFTHEAAPDPSIFHEYKNRRPSQSAAEAIDDNGIAYFGLMSETSINCWNTAREYGPENFGVVEYNPKTLQFPSGVKLVRNLNGEQELWVLTSRFQKVATGTLSPLETNFRIQAVKVDEAVSGTKCKTRRARTQSAGGQYKTQNRFESGGYGLLTTQSSKDKIVFG